MLTLRQKKAIKKSNKRLNIWSGSVRSGKTYGLYWLFTDYAVNGPPGKLAIIAKTLETLRNNILDPMKKLIGPGFSYSDGGRRIKLAGRDIRGVGANDEKSHEKIMGDTLAGVMGDEVTLWPETFFNALYSRLSVKGAQAFFSCNPASPYHWLKRNWIDDPKKRRLLSYHHFTLQDNPTLPDDYVRDLIAGYTGLWRKRYIDGLWVLAEGVIYDMFDEARHVIADWKGDHQIIGVDYGIANPTVFEKIDVSGLKAVVTDEYYYDYHQTQRQKTDGELADDMDQFCKNGKPYAVYCDPSALSFINELKSRGYRVKDADNDVLNGISFVSKMLQNCNLLLTRGQKKITEELSIYSWDKKAQDKGEDKPLKINDHCCDALRYAVYTYFTQHVPVPQILTGGRSKIRSKLSNY